MPDGSNAAALILDDREDGIFRVHRSAFVDREIFELERARIFDRSWLFAGHLSEFPNRGDFVTRSVAGRPVILAHGDDGKIRVLLNTCRHRGNLVCREHKGAGAEFFRCFYHGWIYGTRGELKGVPGEEAYSEAFDRDALGLEPVPRMHNHRGCIFVSFDREIEGFESYMGDALAVFDNTLDLGDMEFVHGQFKYSMRANWKLLVENSMDGYHAAYTHERFFAHWLESEGLGDARRAQQRIAAAQGGAGSNARRGTVPLGNGHVTTYYPSADGRPAVNRGYLEKHAGDDLRKFRAGLVERYGADKAGMVEGGAGNYLIFPNLMVIDGWWVFRTFYPTSPDYMEINGWACLPKNDPPALRKARLEWYLAFQGPGGFATPDDVEGLEGCQMGFATHKEVEWSDISRGMKGNLAGPSELQMRVFWREWHARMTTGSHAECTDD
ncbi:MAG TPA: aromatic ring-hydroxylating dioxygenase subunit alpha [Stellaceae bacterium]|nr:aromatic ring-hydroxylating dioxygenase subunit alpha [Stellaceae bacterium]